MPGAIRVMVPELLKETGLDPDTMSISAFARKLDVAWPTAEALVRGKPLKNVSFEILVKLCDFFKVDDVGQILKYDKSN